MGTRFAAFAAQLVDRLIPHVRVGVIGVLLGDDRLRPVLVDGKPVTALVNVTTALVH